MGISAVKSPSVSQSQQWGAESDCGVTRCINHPEMIDGSNSDAFAVAALETKKNRSTESRPRRRRVCVCDAGQRVPGCVRAPHDEGCGVERPERPRRNALGGTPSPGTPLQPRARYNRFSTNLPARAAAVFRTRPAAVGAARARRKVRAR